MTDFVLTAILVAVVSAVSVMICNDVHEERQKEALEQCAFEHNLPREENCVSIIVPESEGSKSD